MHHKILDKSSQKELANLFNSVFASSEGEEEGALIGSLASELSSSIDNQEIICFATFKGSNIIAAIFFTRLRFQTPVKIYMLAPVAVSTKFQGKGVGQALINYALNVLKNRSVEVVVTYCNPAFYSKLGFIGLSEALIQAPLNLSMPQGWLGQSLNKSAIPAIEGRPLCVSEFNNPAYW